MTLYTPQQSVANFNADLDELAKGGLDEATYYQKAVGRMRDEFIRATTAWAQDLIRLKAEMRALAQKGMETDTGDHLPEHCAFCGQASHSYTDWTPHAHTVYEIRHEPDCIGVAALKDAA
jgi:hypothetical protein